MPSSALALVDADAVVPLRAIPGTLTMLADTLEEGAARGYVRSASSFEQEARVGERRTHVLRPTLHGHDWPCYDETRTESAPRDSAA
jgi:hypothetical protein